MFSNSYSYSSPAFLLALMVLSDISSQLASLCFLQTLVPTLLFLNCFKGMWISHRWGDWVLVQERIIISLKAAIRELRPVLSTYPAKYAWKLSFFSTRVKLGQYFHTTVNHALICIHPFTYLSNIYRALKSIFKLGCIIYLLG